MRKEESKKSALELKLTGYRLSTAEILYWLPDHPSILQSFIWQHYDLAPRFPELNRFISFWTGNIEGRIHLVRVARSDLLKPAEFELVGSELHLH